MNDMINERGTAAMARAGTCRSLRNLHQQGQSLVELALVTPFLMLFILGIFEAVNAFSAYLTLTNASREGARLAARGNLFESAQVLLVTQEHASTLDLVGSGSVLLTKVRSDPLSFTVARESLLGSEASRFSEVDLRDLERQLTLSEPDYLRKEEFVVLEVFYTHRTVTGFISVMLPMYVYTIMQVSAPS